MMERVLKNKNKQQEITDTYPCMKREKEWGKAEENVIVVVYYKDQGRKYKIMIGNVFKTLENVESNREIIITVEILGIFGNWNNSSLLFCHIKIRGGEVINSKVTIKIIKQMSIIRRNVIMFKWKIFLIHITLKNKIMFTKPKINKILMNLIRENVNNKVKMDYFAAI